jgi:hypothetical protein
MVERNDPAHALLDSHRRRPADHDGAWPEVAPRVYDSRVFLESDWVNGLIVSEHC